MTDSKEALNLFTPITIRGCKFDNRMGVPPMVLFEGEDGYPQDRHLVQYGKYSMEAFGFIIYESTSIEPRGRISPKCCGIWSDEFIPHFKRITDFVHKNGVKIGIQLAHAGRKGSSIPPSKGIRKGCVSVSEGGWNVVSSTNSKYSSDWNETIELSTEEISKYPKLYAECSLRAIKCGFDFIEIHGAHGYLVNQFLSPLTNTRNDIYGGSFDNRVKLLKDIIIEVRSVIPKDMPLFVRLSCEDLADNGITINDSINIVKAIHPPGVDLINCSSGGLMADQHIPSDPYFQLKYAQIIKESTGILTAAVGGIATTDVANDVIKNKMADVVLIGRATLRETFNPRRCAVDLGLPVPPYFDGISWGTQIPKHCKY